MWVAGPGRGSDDSLAPRVQGGEGQGAGSRRVLGRCHMTLITLFTCHSTIIDSCPDVMRSRAETTLGYVSGTRNVRNVPIKSIRSSRLLSQVSSVDNARLLLVSSLPSWSRSTPKKPTVQEEPFILLQQQPQK